MEALDVIKNIRPGFGAGTVVSAVYALALEHAEEASAAFQYASNF